MHSFSGTCPVCSHATTYTSENDWFRDFLHCAHCKSIPRERAFVYVLERAQPDWRTKVIHESSPADRKVSTRIRDACPNYIPTQYFPHAPLGSIHKGTRCENLEALTFEDNSIDLHCHLDVMEHVNHPDKCFEEMERTLRPGGQIIFTTPVYEELVHTQRWGYYDDQGQVHFLFEPEYHGNPIDKKGAPVTFQYGQDLANLILQWTTDCGVEVITLNDPYLGVLGKFREVFVVTKRGPAANKVQGLK